MGKSPRSTVGTVTEIADYLRLLFARVGVPHCPKSGKVLRAYTVQEIVDAILERGEGARAAILAPVVRRSKGELREASSTRLRRDGFVRARIDGEQIDLGDELALDRTKPHDLDVVVDRIVVREGAKGRVTDSVELALKLGDGTVLIDPVDGSEPDGHERAPGQLGVRDHAAAARAAACSRSTARTVRAPLATAWACARAIDPGRVVPDDARTLREGAVAAFGRRGSVATATEVARWCRPWASSPDEPWRDLPEEQRQAILLYGTGAGRGKKKASGYEGVIPRLGGHARDRRARGPEDHDD